MKPVRRLDFTSLESLNDKFNLGKHSIIGLTLTPVSFIAIPISGMAWWALVMFLFSLGYVIIALIADWRTHDKANTRALESFAADNKLKFTKHADVSKRPGTIFEHGHSQKASDCLVGKFGDLPMEVFAYHYSTGSGKNKRTYDAQVAELTLPRTMPHMIIDSVIESVGASTLPIKFHKSQKIELEGDFHKYFDLYAPDKYGVSALTIIAPDAMDALMRHAALCDIEIIDNKLYFYWPGPARNKQQFEEMFSTIQEVLDKIGDKLARGDIFAHPTQAKLHAEANAKGVRLKKSYWQNLIATSLVLVYFLIAADPLLVAMEAPPFWRVIIVVLPLVVFFAFTLYVVVSVVLSTNKNMRLRKELLKRYQNAKS